MTVFSVDPGEKNVGWAKWTENGAFVEKGIDSPDKFLSRLLTTRMSLVVVENWRLRKAVRGKTMATSEVIGMLMYHCAALGIPLLRQEPGILGITALHAGIKLPKGHVPDDVSAYLHGYWYFESVGVLAPKPLEDR